MFSKQKNAFCSIYSRTACVVLILLSFLVFTPFSSFCGNDETAEFLTPLKKQHDKTPLFLLEEIEEQWITIVFNQTQLAEGVFGQIDEEGNLVKIRFQDIEHAFGVKLLPAVLQQLRDMQDEEGWVDIAFLSQYTPVFEKERSLLFLLSPPDEKPTFLLDAQHQTKKPPLASQLSYPQEVSAFLNCRHAFTCDAQKRQYALGMDGSLRWKEWVGEAIANIHPSASSKKIDGRFLRLIRDFPDQKCRLIMGETTSLRDRFLIGEKIWGMRCETKNYNYSGKLVSESEEDLFFLENNSEVRFLLNGQEKNRLYLLGGQYYRVSDYMDIGHGQDQISLFIIDDFGRTEKKEISSFRSFRSQETSREFSFFLSEKSSVSFFIDDRLVKEWQLLPGPYTLAHQRFTTGYHRVKIQIDTETGKKETHNFTVIIPPNNLPKETHSFQISAGRCEDQTDHTKKEAFGIAYRKKLLNVMMASLRSQVTPNQRSAALGIDFSLPWANIESDLAHIYKPDRGRGIATQIAANRTFLSTFGTCSVGVKHQTYQNGISSSTYSTSTDPLQSKRLYSMTFKPTHFPGTIDYLYSREKYQSQNIHSNEFRWSYEFKKYWNIEYSYQRRAGKSTKYIALSFQWNGDQQSCTQHYYHYKKRRILRSQINSRGRENRWNGHIAYYRSESLSKPLQSGTILPYQRRENLFWQYHYRPHRFTLDYFGQLYDLNKPSDARHQLILGSSFVYCGGHVSIGQVINDSFVMVTPLQGQELNTVQIRQQRDRYRGKSRLPLVFSHLSDGQVHPLLITCRDQFGELEEREILFKPKYKSGSLLSYDSSQANSELFTVRIHLFNHQGEPIKEKLLLVEDTTNLSQEQQLSFTNREGKCIINGLQKGHTYQITISGEENGHYTLRLPDECNDSEMDIGKLHPTE